MKKLARLLKLIDIDPENAITMTLGGCSLCVKELDIDPYDFLIQAEIDYENGGDSSDLNAITNAKRAIVSQMDQALMSFGYPAPKWYTPRKIETLNSLGIVTPRILRKVSEYRNLLEHEYRRPTEEQVEETLDLASLFVASIKPTLTFCDEFVLGNEASLRDSYSFEKGLCFTMAGSKENEKAIIRVWAEDYTDGDRKIIGEESFTYLDSEFPSIIKLAIASDRGFKVQDSLNELLIKAGLKVDA